MEFFVDQIGNADSPVLGTDRCLDHLTFVPDHDGDISDLDAREHLEITGQQRLPSNLDQTLGLMLCDRPQPFTDSGGQDDSFHVCTADFSRACSNAERNP